MWRLYFLISVVLLTTCCCTAQDAGGTLNIKEQNGFITASIDQVEVMRYAIKTLMPPDTSPAYYQRSGFIHPLKTLSGKTITAGFPKGHMHQHGVFNAWRNAQFKGKFVDFWNQQAQLGTVRHLEVLDIQNGSSSSSFKVALQQVAFRDGDTLPALNETWDIIITSKVDHWTLDWSIQQQCAGEDTLFLDEYHYGGAAFRGCENWNVETGAFDSLVFFITDEGKTHANGNHSRPKWVAMYGETGEGQAGIGMMGHSTNFRHPQPVRIHPVMPYFVFTPSVLGDWYIAPGQTYNGQYRLVVYDGKPPIELLNHYIKSF